MGIQPNTQRYEHPDKPEGYETFRPIDRSARTTVTLSAPDQWGWQLVLDTGWLYGEPVLAGYSVCLVSPAEGAQVRATWRPSGA